MAAQARLHAPMDAHMLTRTLTHEARTRAHAHAQYTDLTYRACPPKTQQTQTHFDTIHTQPTAGDAPYLYQLPKNQGTHVRTHWTHTVDPHAHSRASLHRDAIQVISSRARARMGARQQPATRHGCMYSTPAGGASATTWQAIESFQTNQRWTMERKHRSWKKTDQAYAPWPDKTSCAPLHQRSCGHCRGVASVTARTSRPVSTAARCVIAVRLCCTKRWGV